MNDDEPRPSPSVATAAYLSDDVDHFRGAFIPAVVGSPDETARRSDPAGVTAAELAARLELTGARTRELLSTHVLSSLAPEGPRFDDGPTDLGWSCLRVLQEYARHAGHLDIVPELGAS